MSQDYRSQFVRAIEYGLAEVVPVEIIPSIINVVTSTLNDYEITERCTDIIVADDLNERLVKRYCACLMVDGKSEKTVYQYRRTIQKLSEFLEKRYTEMGAYDIRYFLAAEQQRGVSLRTCENTRANISAFFQWMAEEELIAKNPVLSIKSIKYVDEVRKPFSDVEMDSLRSACQTLKERALIEILISTGARVEELSELLVSDIDLLNLSVHIRHGKGGKERITYTTAVSAKHLNEYINNRKECGVYLFYNDHHKQLKPGGIRYILNNLASRAGVSNVHPHRFRRTFATGLASRGMDIQEICKLLGHSNINTTLKYVYTDDSQVRASYNKYIA